MMKSVLMAVLLLFSGVWGATALAQPAQFNPGAYKDMTSAPTQILVLGTTHLALAPDGWDSAVLDPLLDKLAAFQPDAIMIEALPGETIESLWRYREVYPHVATDYASQYMAMAVAAQISLDMDAPQAEAAVRRTLASWPKKPAAAERRRLAALFVASGDPNSGLVQWWRLKPDERVAGDGITKTMIEQLDKLSSRNGEERLIAARLAVRLGLERVFPIDDHTSDDMENGLGNDMEAFGSLPWLQTLTADPRFELIGEAVNHLNTAEQTLDTYRLLNSYSEQSEASQLDAFIREVMQESGPNDIGRRLLAFNMETRNLRQVANIREVSSQYPGKRLLVVIGASHKPWFEAYLSMMTDVQLVDAERILSAE